MTQVKQWNAARVVGPAFLTEVPIHPTREIH